MRANTEGDKAAVRRKVDNENNMKKKKKTNNKKKNRRKKEKKRKTEFYSALLPLLPARASRAGGYPRGDKATITKERRVKRKQQQTVKRKKG